MTKVNIIKITMIALAILLGATSTLLCNNIDGHNDYGTLACSDTADSVQSGVSALFDSCRIVPSYYASIMLYKDSALVVDEESMGKYQVIAAADRNVLTNSVNKLFVEKSVPVVKERRRLPVEHKEMVDWRIITINIYSQGVVDTLPFVLERFYLRDTIIYSPEFESIVNTSQLLTKNYRKNKALKKYSNKRPTGALL